MFSLLGLQIICWLAYNAMIFQNKINEWWFKENLDYQILNILFFLKSKWYIYQVIERVYVESYFWAFETSDL